MNEYLNDDVILELITYLDAKTLGRFMSTCMRMYKLGLNSGHFKYELIIWWTGENGCTPPFQFDFMGGIIETGYDSPNSPTYNSRHIIM